MAVTLEDVAKLAGVSHMTVSLVIRNDKRITEETRQKVLKAIKELNYQPNYLARGLAGGKTNTIAVVATFFSSFFELNILKGMEMVSNEPEYYLNQYATRGGYKIKKKILMNLVNSKRADGVIVLNIRPSADIVRFYKKNKVPLILIEEEVKGVHTIKSDNFSGAKKAVSYLIKKGKRKIGLVIGKYENKFSALSSIERFNGYKLALKENGIEIDKRMIFQIEDFYFEDGIKALEYFISEGIKPDAIFCAAGDMVAMGIIKEAQKRKIKIPEDIAIIGFDDIVVSEIVNPSLTTVRQPIEKMGQEAYKLAVNAVEGKITEPQKLVFEPELIIRESA